MIIISLLIGFRIALFIQKQTTHSIRLPHRCVRFPPPRATLPGDGG
jgi:hypothetical protein